MEDRHQNVVARRTGIHPSALNEILKGKRGASPQIVRALAEYFNTTEEALIGTGRAEDARYA